MDAHWLSPGLGEQFEMYMGVSAIDEAINEGYGRAMANWAGVLRELSRSISSGFLTTLSVSQRNSLRLLVEWWTAQYDDPEFMASTREDIEAFATGRKSLDDELKVVPAKFQQAQREKNMDEHQYLYHFHLYGLWGWEFIRYDTRSNLNSLQLQRTLAAKFAACQRVAFFLLRSDKTFPMDKSPALSTIQLPRNSNDLPLGGSIDVCPWLPAHKRDSPPYYLWDITAMRTVIVQDLPDCPTYVAISHTWGRWKVQTSAEVSVPGVPWTVPRNTRFDIEDLPNALLKNLAVFAPATHVWFDLFCIPQDGSRRAKIEIANQAAIFGKAYRAIAWLNYVESWAGMTVAIEWLALQWLQAEVNSLFLTYHKNARSNVAVAVQKLRGLDVRLWPGFSYTDHDPSRLELEFTEFGNEDGWFTSLWTLQEVLLRPDMLLCNREWEPFRITDGTNDMLITIDTIASMLWVVRPHMQSRDSNAAIEDLLALFNRSGLDNTLLEPTPLTALALGSRRSCTGRRAEAIMSVVGATNWYGHIDDPEEDLILEQYPLAFLREVQSYIGARFYRSWCEVCPMREVYKRTSEGIRFSLVGSVLPFDHLHHDGKSIVHTEQDGLDDHPSTASWRIDDDGTVIMPDVGIVASTDHDLDEGTDQELMADVSMPSSDDPKCTSEVVNIHKRMRERFPSFVKHAICVRQNLNYCDGLILMSLLPDEDGPMWYTKIGDFVIRHNSAAVEAIETWDVGGWQVL